MNPSEPPRRTLGWFFAAACTLALICGLLEALVSLLLSTRLGILSWKTGNSVPVLIAAPAVYLMIFLPAAVPFAIVDRRIHQAWAEIAMLWSFLVLFGYSATTLMRPWFSPVASALLGLGFATM